MNQAERQQLVNEYSKWSRADFIPLEIEMGTVTLDEADAHANQLVVRFAQFAFTSPTLATLIPVDVRGFVNAYGDYLWAAVDPSEFTYHFWPVCQFAASKQVGAKGN